MFYPRFFDAVVVVVVFVVVAVVVVVVVVVFIHPFIMILGGSGSNYSVDRVHETREGEAFR